MQNYSSAPSRSPMKAGAIDSKISVPASKAAKGPNEPRVKTSQGVKGFAGGVIDPKVKC